MNISDYEFSFMKGIPKVLEHFASRLSEESSPFTGVREQVKKLQSKLQAIQDGLSEAEKQYIVEGC